MEACPARSPSRLLPLPGLLIGGSVPDVQIPGSSLSAEDCATALFLGLDGGHRFANALSKRLRRASPWHGPGTW